jgi:hypothetical protein
MVNVKQLRIDAENLRAKAQAKRKVSEKDRQDAIDYSKAGDIKRTEDNNVLAAFNNQDASELEKQAAAMDQQAIELENQAIQIEQQQEALQASTQAQLDEMERRKNDLREGSSSFF